jgi:hypothetical protein
MRRDDFVGDLLILIATEDGEHKTCGDGGRQRRADGKAAEERPPGRLKELARRDDARRGRGQRRFDAIAQACRCGEFHVGCGHRFAHGAERFQFLGAAGAGRDMRFDVAGMKGIEFAVDQRVQQDFAFGAIHGDVPEVVIGGDPSATFHADRNIDRARASRDSPPAHRRLRRFRDTTDRSPRVARWLRETAAAIRRRAGES